MGIIKQTVASNKDFRIGDANGRYVILWDGKAIINSVQEVAIADTVADKIVYRKQGIDAHNMAVGRLPNGNVGLWGTRGDGSGGVVVDEYDTGIKYLPFEGEPVEPPAIDLPLVIRKLETALEILRAGV